MYTLPIIVKPKPIKKKKILASIISPNKVYESINILFISKILKGEIYVIKFMFKNIFRTYS